MKSSVYKVRGKMFRYNFDTCEVEYLYKASAEEIAEEEDWKQRHGGRPLVGIDADGYVVLSTVGLQKKNWTSKASRDEYLAEWAEELEAESQQLADDFIKYELPYMEARG